MLSLLEAARAHDMPPITNRAASRLITAALELRATLRPLRFPRPVAFVYHPLDYAWPAHREYLRRYARPRPRALFLGMNPGPFGMVQTGVPFGEVTAVRDWLGIHTKVHRPAREHPKRPVTGFGCARSEVSGQRLWGLFRARFGAPARFFRDHFVTNYCPVAFLTATGRNLTPDQLPARAQKPLFAACDLHLRRVVETLEPEWLIGVGGFAAERAETLFAETDLKLSRILHPSPASPAANRNWAGSVTRHLCHLGIWRD